MALLLVVGALVLGLATGCGDGEAESGSTEATDASSETLERDPAGSDDGADGTDASSRGALSLSSSAFEDGGELPATFACDPLGGDGQSPPLAWVGVPEGAASLVLVVHDPDAPIDGGFTHLVTTFPGEDGGVVAGANAEAGPMADWIPACPPDGEHRYSFTLYAFGETDLPVTPTKADIDAVASDALATSEITARFAHP